MLKSTQVSSFRRFLRGLKMVLGLRALELNLWTARPLFLYQEFIFLF